MGEKLTLNVDEDVIRRATDYGRRHGVSVSHLVEGYLRNLTSGSDPDSGLSPIVTRLRGALRDSEVSESGYRTHLIQKHLVEGEDNRSLESCE